MCAPLSLGPRKLAARPTCGRTRETPMSRTTALLAAPAAILKAFRGVRAIDPAPVRSAASTMGRLGQKLLPLRRPVPAGVAPEYIGEDEDEEEDEEEYEYEDEYEYVDEDEDEEDEEEEDDEEELEDEYEEEEDEDIPDIAAERAPASPEELRQKIAMLPLRMGGQSTEIAKDEDIPREENFEGYQFPTLELLEDPEGCYSEQMEEHVRLPSCIRSNILCFCEFFLSWYS